MKFLRLNMTSGLITEKQIPEHYSGLGGRGLTSIISISGKKRVGCGDGVNGTKGTRRIQAGQGVAIDS